MLVKFYIIASQKMIDDKHFEMKEVTTCYSNYMPIEAFIVLSNIYDSIV